jgi:hypothetical protein
MISPSGNNDADVSLAVSLFLTSAVCGNGNVEARAALRSAGQEVHGEWARRTPGLEPIPPEVRFPRHCSPSGTLVSIGNAVVWISYRVPAAKFESRVISSGKYRTALNCCRVIRSSRSEKGMARRVPHRECDTIAGTRGYSSGGRKPLVPVDTRGHIRTSARSRE